MENKLSNYSIEKITLSDLNEIETLAKNNNGGSNMYPDYIKWWYFNNPSKSFCFLKYIEKNTIEGISSTNNFQYRINGKNENVAMPQNVLTSNNVRGKGVFGKLYWELERDNIENGAKVFLTFTNEMSTQIFIEKFKYQRGNCPDLILALFNPIHLLQTKKYIELSNFDNIKWNDFYTHENAMIKNSEYFKWRYSHYPKGIIRIIEVQDQNGENIGYAFLKKDQKKKVNFMMLMDILAKKKEFVQIILDAAVQYSSRNFFPFILYLETDSMETKPALQKTIHNRFNFLVKGQDENDTIVRSKYRYNIMFSDLDIT